VITACDAADPHLPDVFVLEGGALVLGLGMLATNMPVVYWSGCSATVIPPSCVTTMMLGACPVGLLPAFLLKAMNAATRTMNKPKITSLRFISL
jgi:threonine dehydrogenase-like Zn-dependent dehydrogenase